jgi:hypothetical protein
MTWETVTDTTERPSTFRYPTHNKCGMVFDTDDGARTCVCEWPHQRHVSSDYKTDEDTSPRHICSWPIELSSHDARTQAKEVTCMAGGHKLKSNSFNRNAPEDWGR